MTNNILQTLFKSNQKDLNNFTSRIKITLKTIIYMSQNSAKQRIIQLKEWLKLREPKETIQIKKRRR